MFLHCIGTNASNVCVSSYVKKKTTRGISTSWGDYAECENRVERVGAEKSVSARGPRALSSRDEYEIDESVSGGSKGRFHRLTGSRQTKLTMNGQLTWRLCQLTAMADVTREPN